MFLNLQLIAITLSIGLIGWISYFLFKIHKPSDFANSSRSILRKYFTVFVTGFGVVSLSLFGLAVLGAFHWTGFVFIASVLAILYWLRLRNLNVRSAGFRFHHYLLYCLVLGMTLAGIGRILKPYEAAVMANDTSVYIGNAFQTAKSGALSYQDPLVLETQPGEREWLFKDYLFPFDPTGTVARFPHGVHLVNLSNGTVTFSFYHLYPTWLALGMKAMGEDGFLYVSNLFWLIAMLSLYYLGKHLGGVLLGLSVCAWLFFFYPQVYFTRLPMSELLSQALFFSGMLFFDGGSGSVLPVGKQRFMGLLWGSLFLTRIDSMFFVFVSAILSFAFIPELGQQIRRWSTLIKYLFIFVFVAIYHQISTGEYFYLLKEILARNQLWFSNLGTLFRLVQIIHEHPYISHVVFAVSCAAVVLFLGWIFPWRFWEQKRSFRMSAGVLIVLIVLFPFVRHDLSWRNFRDHLSWVALYVPYWLLAIQSIGLLLFVYFQRKENRVVSATLLLFLLAPAICYLISPKVVDLQPWAMRRFVPSIFPLLFLLSLAGYIRIIEARASNQRLFLKPALAVCVLLTTLFFYKRSAFLFHEELFGGVLNQIEEIAEKIPKNSLIIVPDIRSGMHLNLPLQYLYGRDTISLRITKPHDEEYARIVLSYLKREFAQGRPIYVLMINLKDAYVLQKNFSLTPEFTKAISFRMVKPFPANMFPDRSSTMTLNCNVLRLQDKAPGVVRTEIAYNDADVTFLEFWSPEGGFRWTNGNSEITDFRYDTGSNSTDLILTAGLLKPGRNMQNLSIVVNDQVPARFFHRAGRDFYFRIDGIREIHSVTIKSNHFKPVKLKMNADTRELGIRFVKLRFVPSQLQ